MDRRISLLRVTASFMVVLLHVSGENLHAFGEKWWAANFFDSLSRACVPIFFMISGATLLTKNEPLGDFFKKRVIKILPPLLFWSAFYLWWLHRNGVHTSNWAVAILSGPTMYHLWYFYAIIGLYAFIPVVRKFYQHSTRGERAWFIILWFLVASVYPTLQSLYIDKQCGYLDLGVLANQYHLSYFSGYIGYIVLGAFIAESAPSLKIGIAIFAIASSGTMAATYLISKHYGSPCEFFYLYLSPLVVLAAYGLFSAIMALEACKPSKLLIALSDCTLGIYCIHAFMIDPVFSGRGISSATGNPWFTSLTTTIGVFLASFILIYCIRRIKLFRYVT